jgi:linalool 8-monooxygenase
MNELPQTQRKAVPIQDGGLDLKDPDLYAQETCHAVFAQLRAQDPVYWNFEADSAGFWVVTRYDDIVRVAQDPKTFSAAVENGGMRIFNAADVTPQPRSFLLSMDPPQHTDLRRALQPLFTPQRVAAAEGAIRARMTRLIDAIAETGQAEFVSAVAAPLTLGFLTDLLDVPESHSPKLMKWSNAFIGDDDEEYQESIEYRRQCVAEMDRYALDLLSERKDGQGEDFVSLIGRATVDGRALDIDTYTQNFAAFLVAGNETTRHSLSAGVLALSLFPSQKERLLADRSLIGSAIKEIMRWATPVIHVRRTAMKDVTLGGKRIRRGDKVVIWYTSANRDEEKWAEAAQLDIARFTDRAATPHLAFGTGPHHCLGWRFAELQMRVALEELLDRLPDLRAVQPVRRLRSNFVGGIKELPVIFAPRALRAAL